ncbi:hypothetical protein AAF712_000372 [Marasmius tenuissimus]|uniref:Uncharacterized protein n=1 Tax=Marasmius tenuissimus TaxID=585030 RepID=A0ABR3AI40_9AGAR
MSSLVSFSEVSRLKAMEQQRFDPTKKQRTPSLESDRGSPLQTVDTPDDDATGEHSRKIGELWAALDPRHTRSLPPKRKLFVDEDDVSTEIVSSASSILNPGYTSDISQQTTAPTTPAMSDVGHTSTKDVIDSESAVHALPLSSTSNSDNTTEIRITDHIVRYGGTTTRTIVRPTPTISSCGSSVTERKGSPFSRPGTPVSLISSLNCFTTNSFENEVDRICEDRGKKMAGEGELKVFVREEIDRAREARFKVATEELIDERPVAQC